MDTPVKTNQCCVEKERVHYYRPDVDVFENDTEFLFVADIPGSSADKLSIEFQNGKLTIKAAVDERDTGEEKHILREYGVAEFQRSFDIREPVDPDSAVADYQNGVLKVTLKKSAAAGLKKIPVSAVQH